jgi:hypothetical protein
MAQDEDDEKTEGKIFQWGFVKVFRLNKSEDQEKILRDMGRTIRNLKRGITISCSSDPDDTIWINAGSKSRVGDPMRIFPDRIIGQMKVGSETKESPLLVWNTFTEPPLKELTFQPDESKIYETSKVQFVEPEEGLTPFIIQNLINPYLLAMQRMQDIFDDYRSDQPRDPMIIREISYFSPINVSFEGVGDVVRALKDDIVPWRKEHAQEIAELEAEVQRASLARTVAQARRAEAEASTETIEARKREAELRKIEEETKTIAIANEKATFELNKAYYAMAVELSDKYFPQLDPLERLKMAKQLLPEIKILGSPELLGLNAQSDE